jgi:hypothetical protein
MVDLKQSIAASIRGDAEAPRRTSGGVGARVKVWLRRVYLGTRLSSSSAIQRVARAEATDLRRSLSRLGLPQNDVSGATPALARSIAEYERLRRRISQRLVLPLTVLLFLPQVVVIVDSRGRFLPEPGSDVAGLIEILLYFLALTATPIIVLVARAQNRRRSMYWQRLIEYRPPPIWFAFALPSLIPPLIPLGMLIILAPEITLTRHDIWVAMAPAGTVILWVGTIGLTLFWIGRGALLGTLLGSRSPDVVLVRVLADAYTAVVAGGPSDFRSFARRSEIATHLRVAAQLLDGPMLRILSGGDRAAEAVIRPHLEAAAGGLRQKLPWLATPKNDTREYLARALGEALIAATIGDLARLTGAEPAITAAAAASWRDRLVGFARWVLFALGPASALWLGWPLIKDSPAAQGLAAQFAVLCFVVGTFSTLDPSGRDKLSGVVSTGTALFGWGKPKA